MSYFRERWKLEADQERLEKIREERLFAFKVLKYTSGMVIVLAFLDWISTLWMWSIKSTDILALFGVLQIAVLAIVNIAFVITWFSDIRKTIDTVEITLNLSDEEDRLAKTEGNRKAKIEFFKRLENDPEFRKAWEEQMRGGE